MDMEPDLMYPNLILPSVSRPIARHPARRIASMELEGHLLDHAAAQVGRAASLHFSIAVVMAVTGSALRGMVGGLMVGIAVIFWHSLPLSGDGP